MSPGPLGGCGGVDVRGCAKSDSITGVSAPRSRAEQKQHTRALIVAAGREAVATRGFAGLVVRELAREAGIVPTAFYRHFDSVDALASELAAGAAEALGIFVDDLASSTSPDPVTDWPARATAAATRDPQTWSVLARGLVDTAHPDHRMPMRHPCLGRRPAASAPSRRVVPALGAETPLRRWVTVPPSPSGTGPVVAENRSRRTSE